MALQPQSSGLDQPSPAGTTRDVTSAAHDKEQEANPEPPAEGPFLSSEDEYPEGGTRAWSVVLGSWFASFSALGISNSVATIHAYISSHQLAGYSEGQIGWIFSTYMFLIFFCGIYVGPIFDKYGSRWLILSGTICVVAAQMLLSISTQFWHFILAFGVLNGIGGSLLFTPSLAAIGHWFHHRRGLATGIATTGGCFGGIVYPMLLRAMFERAGWAWAIRTVAFIVLVFCGAAILLIDTRLPSAPDASPHPDLRILRDPAFALTTLGIFLLEWSLFIPLTYISSYAIHQGFDLDFAYQIPTILNAGSVAGRILAGWFGDFAGPFNSNILAVALSIVACLAVWLPAGSSTSGIVVFVVLFGFASGNNISISPVCIGKLCKTENYGRYQATAYTVASFACLLDIPIAGEIISAQNGSYWGLILFTGLIYVLSLVALMAAKVRCAGWKITAVF
ncbi:Putative major facilitator superfamily, MFS transporter superfamily [Colletotrichum destructivum]|uniref:Major facilitator superfamily, MFS transporter superfamily n=1 Tax=Colletotrichum destructivum TaxID=34406 RepID=A0AAX4J226_9PEZI|nr:Putative major facilitator superfamily, MFS transporter superfamily [Colletotrichum destructivum]